MTVTSDILPAVKPAGLEDHEKLIPSPVAIAVNVTSVSAQTLLSDGVMVTVGSAIPDFNPTGSSSTASTSTGSVTA